ncbi:nodulation protein NfeD [Hyphomicrobium sp.]|uniref:NfeD family protein n=1 Tax=Hyphomicrobium sp. TaxID=82 RepID=UPI002E32E816|nr:nodulation protein NfeD [Hyphomicrobium sp.]HEX2842181.1 nodulation protein NfeD [Hyphomicrobium sp.]
MKRFMRACGLFFFRSITAVLAPMPTGISRSAIPGILLASLLVTLAAPTARTQDITPRHALLIDVKGTIGFASTTQLTRALEMAKADEATVLIMRIDTPGGLLTATRDMIQAVLASPVPIIAYVAPSGARAASAGTYLVFASHVAAMAPATHLGAATPVELGVPGLPGSSPPTKPSDAEKPAAPEPSDAAERKSVNDAVAYLRTLAELRSRSADWAEVAVREGATLTASEALKKHVVELIADNVNELLTTIDGQSVTTAAGAIKLKTKGLRIVELKPDWKMQVMAIITDPNIAFILMLFGVYGILFEFMSPGAVAPGVVGGISLIVALTALSVLPVNYGGLALLLFGVALMVLEASAPTFGILGLGGIVAFVVGALFLFEPADSDHQVAVAWPVIAGAVAASAAFFAGILGFALRTRRRPVRTGVEEMLGSTGEVVAWSEGAGHIRVHGEVWAAESNQNLPIGQKVRVVGLAGLTLTVEAAA